MIAFILTMPNIGSWNGKWTGEEYFHCVTRKLSKTEEEKLDGENFYYSWNDGWGANIECKKVDSKEAAKMRKKSKGFCGYEWMVNNIIHHGSPYNQKQ